MISTRAPDREMPALNEKWRLLVSGKDAALDWQRRIYNVVLEDGAICLGRCGQREVGH